MDYLSIDSACASSALPSQSDCPSEFTGGSLASSSSVEQIPVDSCVSFAANVLSWDSSAMSFIRSAGAVAGAAATSAAGAAARKTRSYIDIITTPEGLPQLALPRSALVPLDIQCKQHETVQIPLGALSVHRARPRLLLCGAPAGAPHSLGTAGGQFTGADERAKETLDTLFGLEFESSGTETSFLGTLRKLQRRRKPRLQQQQHSQEGMVNDSEGNRTTCRGHLHQMDGSSVTSYFGYYERHSTQRDMLRDPTRTAAYRAALSQNCRDIKGKRVMDVGAGSGILSFFAAMQGAKQVYAVEASGMAATARALAEGNPAFGERVQVLQQPVETLELSQLGNEKVDVLVSEPLGTLLFNERMIESYLFARDNFLKPGGLMFPRRSRLFCALFTDASLFAEVCARGAFWQNDNFHGVDLRRAVPAATDEAFRQPIVDYVDPRCLVAEPQCTEFDFAAIQVEDLHEINLNFSFHVRAPSVIHGLATWFTVEFEGSDFCVGFSTGPDGAPTHWFQLRLLMRPPLAANAGQTVKAHLRMLATQQQSYKIDGKLNLEGTEFSSACKDVDLKDPDYRYYTNPAQSYCPSHQSTEAFWSFPSATSPASQNQCTEPVAPAAPAAPISMVQPCGANPWESWQEPGQLQYQQALQHQRQQVLQRQQQVPLQHAAPATQNDDDVAAVNEDMIRVFRPS